MKMQRRRSAEGDAFLPECPHFRDACTCTAESHQQCITPAPQPSPTIRASTTDVHVLLIPVEKPIHSKRVPQCAQGGTPSVGSRLDTGPVSDLVKRGPHR